MYRCEFMFPPSTSRACGGDVTECPRRSGKKKPQRPDASRRASADKLPRHLPKGAGAFHAFRMTAPLRTRHLLIVSVLMFSAMGAGAREAAPAPPSQLYGAL